MGRRTRALLPTHQNLLKADGDQGTNKKLENYKAKQAKLYINKCRPLDPLQRESTIRMRLPGDQHWSLGTCTRALGNRSNEVEVEGKDTVVTVVIYVQLKSQRHHPRCGVMTRKMKRVKR